LVEENFNSLSNSISESSQTLGIKDSLIILLLSLFIGILLRAIFIRYGESMSSKLGLGNALLLIIICVSSLIAVVKSSLALSLGLVGALSVIRFRTAIKEPYSLACLLLSICIGISLGASQFTFAFATTIFGCLTIVGLNIYRRNYSNFFSSELDNLNIELKGSSDLDNLYSIIEQNVNSYSIRSFNEDEQGSIFINLKIDIKDRHALDCLRTKLRESYKEIAISFYDSPNV